MKSINASYIVTNQFLSLLQINKKLQIMGFPQLYVFDKQLNRIADCMYFGNGPMECQCVVYAAKKYSWSSFCSLC